MGGAFRDGWALELDAERTVRLDLESADFDAWVSVIDEEGREIAFDDDSGSGFDASRLVTLPAGGYRILASSFGPGAVGRYTLTVAEEIVAAAAVGRLTNSGDASYRARPSSTAAMASSPTPAARAATST